MRGDGSVYRRGRCWWIAYYVNGKLIREPAGDSKTAAKEKLKATHEQLLGRTYRTPEQRRVTVGNLLDDLLVHLHNKGLASAAKAESHLEAVRAQLGHFRAESLDTATLERYQAARLEAGRAPATVNRECELLRQALRHAARVTPPKIGSVLDVPMLKVENARQGFLSRADFDALAAAIEDANVRDFLEWNWWDGHAGRARRDSSRGRCWTVRRGR